MQGSLKSPWRAMSEDSLISLSNSRFSLNHSSSNKKDLSDRFVNDELHKEGICKRLNFNNQDIESELKKGKFGGKQMHKISYESMLGLSLRKKTAQQSTLNFGLSKYRKLGTDICGFLDSNEDIETIRTFPTQPYKVLNAPKLKDDFYTNLLDWSKNDFIGVVLDNAAFVWPSKGSEAEKVIEGSISSLKWGTGLIIGQQTGKIRVIDVQKRKQSHRSRNHMSRVGTLDVSYSGNEIISGSKDSDILLWDIRQGKQSICFQGHRQQVCGLKWSPDYGYIASGGNDNLVIIWEPRMGKCIGKLLDHTAAVKALAWSPLRAHLLATGGGSTDKSIKLWDTSQMTCINSTDTGSQICNMVFSRTSNQIVTTHGYSLNSIMVWDAKRMQKLTTLQGHSYRVLYLAQSPEGENIVTGSGDQTLRFWKLFPRQDEQNQTKSSLSDKCIFLR